MDRPTADDTVAVRLLRHLFGDLDTTMLTLASGGWKASPYYQLVHPTLAQRCEESMRLHERLHELGQDHDRPPTLEDLRAKHQETPCYPRDELTQLLGECVWNLFSNNHTVTGPEDEVYDLGSFRGSGDFIADFIQEHYPSERISYDYMDFYCAGWWHHDRVDLKEVYALLFRRLQERGCDWEYTFPRIYLIDPNPEAKDDTSPPEDYDPAGAMQRQLDRAARRKELDAFQAKLDAEYEQSREEARFRPPPEAVAAYRSVYGQWPVGWISR